MSKVYFRQRYHFTGGEKERELIARRERRARKIVSVSGGVKEEDRWLFASSAAVCQSLGYLAGPQQQVGRAGSN